MRLRRACTPEGASANPKSRRWSAKKKQAQENVGPWPHTGSMATKGFLAPRAVRSRMRPRCPGPFGGPGIRSHHSCQH